MGIENLIETYDGLVHNNINEVTDEIYTSGLEMYTGIGGFGRGGFLGGLRAPSAICSPGGGGFGSGFRASSPVIRPMRDTEYIKLSSDPSYEIGITHHNIGLGKLKVYDKDDKTEYSVPVTDIPKLMENWRIERQKQQDVLMESIQKLFKR